MEIQKGIRKPLSTPTTTMKSKRVPSYKSSRGFHMDKKNMFLGLALLLIILAVIFLQLSKNFYSNIYTGKNSPSVLKNKTEYNVLLMGYGGGNHEGTYLTDTMMVAHVDTKKNTVLLVSLPRDTWTKLPLENEEVAHAKINSVYQMGLFPKNYPAVPQKYRGDQGAADMIKYVVKYILGIPVDYYVALDFDGFRKAIDVLGGVDISVKKSFDDYKYPLDVNKDDTCGKVDADLETALLEATKSPEIAFPCRYEHLHFDVGSQHMDGTKALKFVRSRQSAEDGGDFARASRQQLLIEAVKAKIISVGFIPKIIPLMNELDNHVKTDLPLDLMQKILKEYADTKGDYAITHLVLSTDNYLESGYSDNRQYILKPKIGIDNWTEVRKAVSDNILGVTPTPMVKIKTITPTK
ncbi:MAG: LCP family protein [Candidatus Roizmanbacteria bacterium]